MSFPILQRYLKEYEGKDYVIRKKASVMFVFGLFMFVAVLFLIGVSAWLGIRKPMILIPLFFAGSGLFIALRFLLAGYFAISAHLMMGVCFSAIWITLFGEIGGNIAEQFDTTIILAAALAMTPIAVSEKRSGIIFYYCLNSLIFLVFLFFLYRHPNYPADLIAEYAADSFLAILGMGIASYYIFNINSVALNNARESENRLRKERDRLDQRVQERTSDLNRALEKMESAGNQIRSSLRYARKIQLAVLPDRAMVDSIFKDYFIIWIPRDHVGGDFYYIDKLSGITVVAVADCTGHGVPGAFMTMVAGSGLRRIVREEKCFSPDEILKRLNDHITRSLGQDRAGSISDEGLDIGICVMVQGINQLVFAGAKMPLYYIQNGFLEVIKGDRHSVGYVTRKKEFTYTSHKVILTGEEVFYMSTDGFTDQPGGESGRRFGTNRLKDLIQQNRNKNFDNQQLSFLGALEAHKANRSAVDDITVVGFRP